MSTPAAAVLGIAALCAAALLPTVWVLGLRWVSLLVLPLAGSVVAALAATCFLALGLTFMTWFVGLSLVLAVAVLIDWWARATRRPWMRAGDPVRRGISYLSAGAVGLVAVLGACAWGLRALATPTVGFDARAVWVLRAGWFLQSHQQLLDKMRVPDVPLLQSAYPPLVSATISVVWNISGNESVRVGVVVVALINVSALAAAAFALVEAGRRSTARLCAAPVDASSESGPGYSGPGDSGIGGCDHPRTARRAAPGRIAALAPTVLGIGGAALVVLIAFGVTEPFMTNGYADPIWSLAGVGAVAYGLQLGSDRSDLCVAFLLVLVAGLSKNEGTANAVPLVALVGGRAVLARLRCARTTGWWRPIVVGALVLATVGAWPELVKAIHAHGATTAFSLHGPLWSRTVATYHGLGPYLHVLVLAAAVAVTGGLLLSSVRRASGIGNDLWAWGAVAGGLVTVGGAIVFGSGPIAPWLEGSVHRISEFDVLAGWWIVGMWGIAASGAIALDHSQRVGDLPASERGPRTGVPASSPTRVSAGVSHACT